MKTTYIIKKSPEFDLKFKLKAKKIFSSEGELEVFMQICNDCRDDKMFSLNDSQKSNLEELGCAFGTYVCDCGYCQECVDKRKENAFESLSHADQLAIKELMHKAEELSTGAERLSENAKKVWDGYYNPFRYVGPVG
jgi:hypothetical protein